MDLLPTQEQMQLVDACINFLSKEFPVSKLLQRHHSTQLLGRDKQRLIAELGYICIGLEENLGGIGYGLSEEVLIFTEMGRHLMSPSLLASNLAARIAALTENHALKESLLSGEKIVAATVATSASKAALGKTVSGEFLLFDCLPSSTTSIKTADCDLVLLVDEKGAALVDAVALTTVNKVRSIDDNLNISMATLEEVPALAYLPTEQDNIYLRGALLCAAMMLGIAEATLERSVNYAKQREQFGKPIGSFQAIKHTCADMAIRCESLRAMLYHASITLGASKLGTKRSDGKFDVVSAKALAAHAAQTNANAAVQIHGGMGFTQEMDIHLFVKRAQVLDQLFGDKRKHLNDLLTEPAALI